jgi:hypothetical protein
MADTGSRFMQSAARLEGVVRALKTRQIEEHQGRMQFAPGNLAAESPDELWAKQFATQCIGPVCYRVATGNDMALPPLTRSLQSIPPAQQGAHTAPHAAAVAAAVVPAPARREPIGAVIGKPARRRLFARMFGRV